MDDKKYFIMKDLRNKWKFVESKGYEVVAIFLQGSQNYNQDIYDEIYRSDIDAKCFVIPSFEDLIKGKSMVSKTYVFGDGSHVEVKDIRLCIDLWTKANPSYLELLCTEYYLIDVCMWDILEMRDEILNMNKLKLYKAILGTMEQKRARIYKPRESTEEKNDLYGYDSKELSHLIRYYAMMVDLVDGYSLVDIYPMKTPESQRRYELSLRTKINNDLFTYEEAKEMADKFIDIAERKYKTITPHENTMRDKTKEKLSEYVYDIVERKVCEKARILGDIYAC